MIIVKLSGGLGNQMFEYAFARALSFKYKQTLFLDKTVYKIKTKNTPRKYFLNFFCINSFSFVSRILSGMFVFLDLIYKILFRRTFIIKEKLVYKFDDNLKIKKNGINYLYGYWQSYKYFEDFSEIILKDFIPKITWIGKLKEMDDKIISSNSISIHVRRGDYVGHQDHEVCNIEYYQKSINFFQKSCVSPIFYVFSDGVDWVKDNLKFNDATVVFVSGNGFNEAEELILMSHCKHNIISNSSFSWWAAWLNKNFDKKVVAPKRWVNSMTPEAVEDLIPKNWIRELE
ncbi:MAG: alpha-1,2-fucosyltransferase [Candidatus Magasanikiibacteriota bacterium]